MLGPEKLHPAAEGLSLLVCQGLPEHPPANSLSRPGRKTSILRPVPLWEFCPYPLPVSLLNVSYMEQNNLICSTPIGGKTKMHHGHIHQQDVNVALSYTTLKLFISRDLGFNICKTAQYKLILFFN